VLWELRAAQRGVREGREEAVAGGRIPCAGKTYTFSPPNVYVLLTIRIRLDEIGYTFGPCNRWSRYFERRGRQSKGASFGRRKYRPACRRGIQQAPSRRHEDGCWGLCFSGGDPRAGV